MVVPYGDTSDDFYFRNVFDAGEYNLGKTVGSLSLGCDCLGEIRYLDAVLADEGGAPHTITNAICLHEEDYGILWKHWDFRYGEQAEVRRSRRLVVSAIHTIGNYEYGFFWYFYLDGTIQFEAKLTGIVQTRAVARARARATAPWSPRSWTRPTTSTCSTCAWTWRSTGRGNSVVEVDAVGLPVGPDNPYGNAIVARQTAARRTSGTARRTCDPRTARTWKIVNPHVHNRLGDPVALQAGALHRPDAARRARTATSPAGPSSPARTCG